MNSMFRKRDGLALALALLIGGCGAGGQLTDTQYVQEAEQAIAKGDVKTALIQLKNALVVNGDNMRARWLLGELQLEAGAGAAAEKELRKARELGVDEEAVLPKLARALVLQGKFDEVILLRPSKSYGPNPDGELLATQAFALLAKGRVQEAEAKVAEALGRVADSPHALTTKAQILLTQDRAPEAEALLRQAVKKSPDHAPAWSLLGDLDSQANKPEAALEDYTQAIDNRENNAEDRLKRALLNIQLERFDQARQDIAALKAAGMGAAHYAEGLIHFQQRQYKEALDAFALVLKQNPDHFLTSFFAAVANAELGNLEQADTLATRVYAANPQYIPGRKLLALLKARRGDFKEVENLLRPVVQAKEDDVFAMNLLATALLRTGATDEAVGLLDRVAKIQPDSPQAQARLGASLLLGGKQNQGIEHLRTAVGLDPKLQQADLLLILNHMRAKQWDKAQAAVAAFQERNPGSPLPHTLRAQIQLAQGNRAKALEALDRANQIAPGDPGANMLLAALANQDKNLDQARGYYEAILKHHPDHVPALVRLAELESRTGKAEAMETHLRAAINAAPAAVAPRVFLARYRLLQGKPREALELLGEVEDKGGRDPTFLSTLGQAQLADKAPEKARRTFDKLVEVAPKSEEAHFLLARTAAMQGDAKAMEASLETSLKLRPDYFPARLAYTRLLLLRRDLKGGEESLALLKKSKPEDPNVKLLEGLVASVRDRPEEAAAALGDAFETAPTTTTLLALFGQTWKDGDKGAALAMLEKWLTDHPQDLKARFTLAEALVASDRKADAITHYQAILKQAPESVPALNNLAWHLRDTDPKQALEHARKAAELAPKAPDVLDTYAMLLAANGDVVLAQRTLERALDQRPDSRVMRYHKAQLLNQAGNREQAIALLKEVLASDQPFPERAEAERLLKSWQ